VFKFGSEFTFRARYFPIRPYIPHGERNPEFSGSPPFELHYRGEGSPVEATPSPISLSCDRFQVGFDPPGRGGLWVGNRRFISGSEATFGNDFSGELALVSLPYGQLTFTMATGASSPRDIPPSAMKTPEPLSAMVFQAYTAAYGAVTAGYVAIRALWHDTVTPLIATVLSFGSEEGLATDLGEEGDPRVKGMERHEEARRRRAERDSDLFAADVLLSFPYSLAHLADDYSSALGERVPVYLTHLRWDGTFWEAGAGVFRNCRLSRIAGTGSAAPSNDCDYAVVNFVHGRLALPRLFARVDYAIVGWDPYPEKGEHVFRSGYHVFSEIGLSHGRTRASFMFACASGNADTEYGRHVAFPVEYDVLEPYEALMFHTYAGGVPAWEGPPDFEHGGMSDAYAFGARVEFAAAANLDLWAGN
jgi:hypothetical protein